MTLSRLAELSADPTASFVLIARDGADTVELLSGDVVDVELLADIPLSVDGTPREVFAMVPYRQVRERGFVAQDDGAPLRCVIVDEHLHLPTAELLPALPSTPVPLHDDGFDIADADYAAIVETVIADEIGRGEGANFVIRRDFTATIDVEDRTAALTWFRALLTHERGAYWTFAVVTPGHIAVGASPEAHVVAREGVVTMNPISGTFRHPAGGATKETLVDFLASTKETEELFMVVDEELKMMSAVCSDGGRITGPHLKEMSRLTHTEYMLRGRSALDPRDILRETMFAPTVTGSPMQNACAVIRRHEQKPRGYYSGVAALFTPNTDGGHDLDAPILIRTVYLQDGTLSVPVGATLVRHSDPMGEVSETHGKAAASWAPSARSTATGWQRHVATPTRPATRAPSPTTRPSPSCCHRATPAWPSSGSTRRARTSPVRSPAAPLSSWTRRTASRRCWPTSCVISGSPSRSLPGPTCGTRTWTPPIWSSPARVPATLGIHGTPASRGCAMSSPADWTPTRRCSRCASATRSSPTSSASP